MKRNSEEAAFAMDFLFNDDEAGTMKRARNAGPRPGGRNMHGSVEFSETTWGRMLREDHAELVFPGSAAASLLGLLGFAPSASFFLRGFDPCRQ